MEEVSFNWYLKRGEGLRIGVSLPVDYLTGKVSCEADKLWTQIYGSVDQCLRSLRGLGITSVEINKLSEETSPSQLKHAVEVIGDIGLGITIHGWLPEMKVDPCLPPAIQKLEKALMAYPLQGLIPFTVHSHSYESSVKIPDDEAAKQTLHDLNLLSRTLVPKSVFAVALELCRYKERRSVGVTFNDVFSMSEQIGLENLGLCWDVGHSQANYRNQQDFRLPSEEFARKVIHTHIHDIGPDGRTHGPIVADQGYVRDCVDILKDSGYCGIYNLELFPLRWRLSPKECRSRIETSINSMLHMLIE